MNRLNIVCKLISTANGMRACSLCTGTDINYHWIW